MPSQDHPSFTFQKSVLIRTGAVLVTCGLCLSPVHKAAPQQQPADLVLFNGNVITVDSRDTITRAIAVKNGLILDVGENAQMQPYIGAGTRLLNLNGRTVTPGLIDSHTHVAHFGMIQNYHVNLRPASSIADILRLLEERIKKKAPGEWVSGDGFLLREGKTVPTRYDLDPISPNNPVFVSSIGGHFGTANSKALEAAGINKNTPNPEGGIIDKDPVTGELTGILWNHVAMNMVRKHYPPVDLNDLIVYIQNAQEKFVTEGLTSFQDVNAGTVRNLRAFEGAENDLKLRGYVLLTIEKPEDALPSLNQTQLFRRPLLTYAGGKFLLDGQVPTSYTYEPHPGPSWDLPTWEPTTLKAVAKSLHRAGHQLAFHVMGDRAIDLALDAIEEAQNESPRADHRHRLEHCMIPTPEAVARIKRLGVVVSFQPGVISMSGDYSAAVWGPARAERMIPLRTFLAAGIPISLGSDFPETSTLGPQVALWGAVVRKAASGKVITPQESITIQEALRAHTMGSAYAAFEENYKGSIEKGKFADLDVWSDDLYAVPTDGIKDLRIIMTIVAGRMVAMMGDVNGDERVDVLDFAHVIRYILQQESYTEVQYRRADIVADDQIDIRDLAAMVLLILQSP